MRLNSIASLSMALVLVAAACGQSDSIPSGPPVGNPMLPDLMVEPPLEVRTRPEPDGRIMLLFTSTLVNVGDGDFILSGVRDGESWHVEQEVMYSESGVEIVPVDASMEWGGDEHDHWHVDRVAIYWLEALDENGQSVEDFERRFDSKVGFCFFDSHHPLEFGPPELAYHPDGCAELDSETFRMGLSRGWSDVYSFFLPGQEVDISGLDDGMYRLWAEADAQGWFRESDPDNNSTWVDIDLSTRQSDGVRLALVVAAGPKPGES